MSNTKKIFTVISIYIGTLLGAGFASGQELLQFFLLYGKNGYVGIIISGILLFISSCTIMLFSKNNSLQGYNDLFKNAPTISRLTDIYMSIYTFFLIGIMSAGAGSLFNTLTSLPKEIGAAIMLVFCLISCIANTNTAYAFLRKILLSSLILIMLSSILIIKNGEYISLSSISSNRIIPWYISSIIFVSNNLIALLVVLIPQSGSISRRNIFTATSLSSLIIVLLALLSMFSMQYNYSNIISKEIPMVPLAFNVNIPIGILYSAIMFVAIYTTIFCCTMSLCKRLSEFNLPIKFNYWVFIVLIASFSMNKYTFSTLIKVVYSGTGLIGFIIITAISIKLIFYNSNRN